MRQHHTTHRQSPVCPRPQGEAHCRARDAAASLALPQTPRGCWRHRGAGGRLASQRVAAASLQGGAGCTHGEGRSRACAAAHILCACSPPWDASMEPLCDYASIGPLCDSVLTSSCCLPPKEIMQYADRQCENGRLTMQVNATMLTPAPFFMKPSVALGTCSVLSILP